MSIPLTPQGRRDNTHDVRIHVPYGSSQGSLSTQRRSPDERGQECVFNRRGTLFINKEVLSPAMIMFQENCLHDAGLPNPLPNLHVSSQNCATFQNRLPAEVPPR